MAADTPISPARVTLYNKDTAGNRSNSSAIMTKFGSGMNYIMDRIFYTERFTFGGYFRANYIEGGEGLMYVKNDTKIDTYICHISNTGTSGTNEINFNIYDNTGSFVGTLFGTGAQAFRITGVNRTNVAIGRKVADAVNITENITGVTYQVGTLNFTTLLAGWKLIPDIITNGTDALNLKFNFILKQE